MQVRYIASNCYIDADFTSGSTIAVFRDGAQARCISEDNAHYQRMAEKTGYGTCTGGMEMLVREHTLCHTLIAERTGQPYSLFLWDRAHHSHVDRSYTSEQAVLDFQAYLNGDEAAGTRLPKQVRDLKEEALFLLRDPVLLMSDTVVMTNDKSIDGAFLRQ